jgi:hypothetical protein
MSELALALLNRASPTPVTRVRTTTSPGPAASWVVAGNVQADRVLTLAVVGANIQGNVRALMGPRAAVAFGVALGLSTLAARLIGRLLK